MRPLNRFLNWAKKRDKTEIQWQWDRDADAEKSFEQIKEDAAKATLIYHPSENTKLALITDFSNFAMDGVLQKIYPDGRKPLGFYHLSYPLHSANIQHMTGNYWWFFLQSNILGICWRLRYLYCT